MGRCWGLRVQVRVQLQESEGGVVEVVERCLLRRGCVRVTLSALGCGCRALLRFADVRVMAAALTLLRVECRHKLHSRRERC